MSVPCWPGWRYLLHRQPVIPHPPFIGSPCSSYKNACSQCNLAQVQAGSNTILRENLYVVTYVESDHLIKR